MKYSPSHWRAHVAERPPSFGDFRILFLVAMLVLLVTAGSGQAQTNSWNAVMDNSKWYVPVENLLAYSASGTDLTDALPVADQTLWFIPSSVDGVFSGTSVASFKIGDTVTTSTTAMNGVVTESGQVRIFFTTPDAPTIIGIGQVREIESIPFMEMQMISGSESAYLTHWAYMAPYDGDPGSLPPLEISPDQLTSSEWAWMEGTSWNLQNDELFGEGGVGYFEVDAYHNGYYWGTGTGPLGSAAEEFSFIGSATPEGNILFNLLSGDTLTSLTGVISGTASTGEMVLRSYSTAGTFGDPGMAQVVPEPSVLSLALLAGGAAILIRRRPPR